MLHYSNFAAAERMPDDDVAALSKFEDRSMDGLGHVHWRAGLDCGRDRIRLCACFRHRAVFKFLPCLPCPAGWLIGGLAQGTLLTTYCYWGYYNITFLGSEVRRPERTIPRAILLSVLLVAAFYLLMDLAVLPSLQRCRGTLS